MQLPSDWSFGPFLCCAVITVASSTSCSSVTSGQRAHLNDTAGHAIEEDTSESDAALLARLSHLLGGPLPSPADDDPIGIDEPSFRSTRAFMKQQHELRNRHLRIRATAWKNRTHTLEVGFPDGCDLNCALPLADTIERWIGPVSRRSEGNAQFVSTDLDTLRLIFEIYPKRPKLTRLLMQCHPLYAVANGRAPTLPGIGEKPQKQPSVQCRPIGAQLVPLGS